MSRTPWKGGPTSSMQALATRASSGFWAMTGKNRKAGLTIGSLARRAATKVPTIRYYETIGLMPAPFRSDGNQRLY
ncbi:MerR family DNA-binding transcriptional regulator, partial [Acinetobacter baumannii]|uniref:MerR family DNA-binding transcriptional regulator n=1 Tax=Acinetobacter baumannii TaxID=470 RepID=UPI0027D28083